MLLSRRSLLTGLGATSAGALLSSGVEAQPFWQTHDVGLWGLDPETPKQNCDQWCWAASIQTIFGALGHKVEQEEIVGRIKGSSLPCQPASDAEMLAAINQTYTDSDDQDFIGSSFVAKARTSSPFNYAWWSIAKVELMAGRPLLAAYRTGPFSGHAVVITHLRYSSLKDIPISCIRSLFAIHGRRPKAAERLPLLNSMSLASWLRFWHETCSRACSDGDADLFPAPATTSD